MTPNLQSYILSIELLQYWLVDEACLTRCFSTNFHFFTNPKNSQILHSLTTPKKFEIQINNIIRKNSIYFLRCIYTSDLIVWFCNALYHRPILTTHWGPYNIKLSISAFCASLSPKLSADNIIIFSIEAKGTWAIYSI